MAAPTQALRRAFVQKFSPAIIDSLLGVLPDTDVPKEESDRAADLVGGAVADSVEQALGDLTEETISDEAEKMADDAALDAALSSFGREAYGVSEEDNAMTGKEAAEEAEARDADEDEGAAENASNEQPEETLSQENVANTPLQAQKKNRAVLPEKQTPETPESEHEAGSEKAQGPAADVKRPAPAAPPAAEAAEGSMDEVPRIGVPEGAPSAAAPEDGREQGQTVPTEEEASMERDATPSPVSREESAPEKKPEDTFVTESDAGEASPPRAYIPFPESESRGIATPASQGGAETSIASSAEQSRQGGARAIEETDRATELEKQKQEDLGDRPQGFNLGEFAKQNGIEMPGIGKTGNPAQAASAGKRMGTALAQRIREGHFNAFVIALGLALAKDGWDMASQWFDGGLTSAIVSVFISGALWAILASQSNFVSRFIRKSAIRMVCAVFMEFIPILSFAPIYTLLVIWLKRDIDKERGRLEQSQKELDKALQRLGMGMKKRRALLEMANARK